MREVEKDQTECFTGLSMELDPLITLGVKQEPEKAETEGQGLWLGELGDVTTEIRERTIQNDG